MAVHLNTTPVLGLPQYDGWAHVVFGQSQRLVCAVSIAGTNAGNVGRDISERLESFSSVDPQELYDVLTSLQDDIHQKECQFQLACGLFDGERATFAALGGRVMLKRSGKVGMIVHADAASREIKIVSGSVQLEDVVILLTDQADGFAEEINQKLTQGYDIDTIITSIVPALHRKADSAKSALAFIAVGKEKQIQKQTPTVDQSPAQSNERVAEQQQSSAVQAVPIPESENKTNLAPENQAQAEESLANFSSDSEERSSFESEASSFKIIDSDKTEQHIGSFVQGRTQAFPQQTETISPPPQTLEPQRSWIADAPPPYSRLEPRQAPVMVFLGRIMTSLKKILSSALGFFKRGTFRNSQKQADVFAVTQAPNKKPPLRIILPFVIVILLAAAGGWRYQSTVLVQRAEAAELVSPLLQQVDEARDGFDSDPVSSRRSVEEVIQKLGEFETSFEDKKHAQVYVQEQKAVVESYFQEISGKEEISQLEPFYDLRFALDGFIASSADAAADTALFLDKEQRSVVQLNLDTKEIVTGTFGEDDRPVDLAFTGERVLLLGNGLFTLTEKDGSFEPIRMRDDESESAGGQFIDHFGRFLYVFHPEDRTIYRFAPESDTKYAAPTQWLRDKQDLDFDAVTSMVIDGDLWLGTRDGKIFKYRSGNRETFEINGLSDPFSSRLVLFTNEDDDNLYVLESDKKRLVVLSKSGDYIKEVSSASLATATTILVREDQNKAYAVSGAEIFEVGL